MQDSHVQSRSRSVSIECVQVKVAKVKSVSVSGRLVEVTGTFQVDSRIRVVGKILGINNEMIEDLM